MSVLSKEKLEQTSYWLSHFREDWYLETPVKIHGRGVDDGHGLGGPPFNPEFEQFLGPICFCGRKPQCAVGCRVGSGGRHLPDCDRGCPSSVVPKYNKGRNTESRQRTTRAFRKLRKIAPREFDALYLMCALGASFEATRAALNERAERLGKPERYGQFELALLVVSGVDKVKYWW